MWWVKPIVKIVAKVDTPMVQKVVNARRALLDDGTIKQGKKFLLRARNVAKGNGPLVLVKFRRTRVKIVLLASIQLHWGLNMKPRVWLVRRVNLVPLLEQRKVIVQVVFRARTRTRLGKLPVFHALRVNINRRRLKPNANNARKGNPAMSWVVPPIAQHVLKVMFNRQVHKRRVFHAA